MTRIIPVSAIESVRLTCRGCGFGMVIPLPCTAALLQCPSCAARMPGREAQQVVSQLRWLKDSAVAVAFGFEAAWEALEERC